MFTYHYIPEGTVGVDVTTEPLIKDEELVRRCLLLVKMTIKLINKMYEIN